MDILSGPLLREERFSVLLPLFNQVIAQSRTLACVYAQPLYYREVAAEGLGFQHCLELSYLLHGYFVVCQIVNGEMPCCGDMNKACWLAMGTQLTANDKPSS